LGLGRHVRVHLDVQQLLRDQAFNWGAQQVEAGGLVGEWSSGHALLPFDFDHVGLHCGYEILVVECNDILLPAISLHLLDNFIINLLGVAIGLPVLENNLIELKIQAHHFG
jgi:hypothetical protein